MRRQLFAATLIAGLFASDCQAGLQSALTTALTGLQAAEVTIGLGARFNPSPSFDDALYIDPIRSTVDEPVFRSGPELVYEPTTGDLSVFAPPMMGPADEFGQRARYTADSIHLYFSDHRAASPRLPIVTNYSRNQESHEEALSFVAQEDPHSASVIESNYQSILVSSSSTYPGLSGLRVEFNEWLSPMLSDDLFEAQEPEPTDSLPIYISVWPYYANPLAEIEARVSYRRRDSLHESNAPYRVELTATAIVVPEPAGVIVIATLVLLGTSRSRRRG